MQLKFATALPGLGLWGPASSSPVVTMGKPSLLDLLISLHMLGRVGAGDCKTNDGSNDVVFQPSFPAS